MTKMRMHGDGLRRLVARRRAAVAPVLALLAGTLGAGGCSTAPRAFVPARHQVSAGLVGTEALDGAEAGRNDGRLGTQRDAFVRIAERIESSTMDRQWILNGRPYDRYRSTTFTRERLER